MKINPTIVFYNGKGREALEYYQKVLGAKVVWKATYADAKKFNAPEEALKGTKPDWIMHSELVFNGATFMLSDWHAEKVSSDLNPANVEILVQPETAELVDEYTNKLGKEGHIVLPPKDVFWNARYAHVIDKYGVAWHFNYQKPESK